jgi:acetate kinase
MAHEIRAMCAAPGGLDGLVFACGIGENDAATRAGAMRGCAWLRLAADEAGSAGGERRLGGEGSIVAAFW